MTDLEATKLCAEAMGFRFENGQLLPADPEITFYTHTVTYDPLHDDTQCMALIKRFKLHIVQWDTHVGVSPWGQGQFTGDHPDLNRAVVMCVAQMQQAKQPLAQDAPGM